jgi:hypothetical protein
MVDVNRIGFTNEFEDDSRFAEGPDHAASCPAGLRQKSDGASNRN